MDQNGGKPLCVDLGTGALEIWSEGFIFNLHFSQKHSMRYSYLPVRISKYKNCVPRQRLIEGWCFYLEII